MPTAFDTSVRDSTMHERRRRLAAEQAAVLSKVRNVLFGLRERLGVRTAYVVGSIRSPALWHEVSDVDVAVGGCSREVLFRHAYGTELDPAKVGDLAARVAGVRNAFARDFERFLSTLRPGR